MTCPLCPLTAYLLLLTAYGYEMKASRLRGLLSFIAGVGYDVGHLSGKPVSRKLVLITGIGQTPERNCAKLPKKEYGQMVGEAQKTKVNYHKKQK